MNEHLLTDKERRNFWYRSSSGEPDIEIEDDAMCQAQHRKALRAVIRFIEERGEKNGDGPIRTIGQFFIDGIREEFGVTDE